MSLAATLKAMAMAGCTPEQMVAVAEAGEKNETEKAELKRQQGRARQQKKRERDAMSRNVTRDERDTPVPPFSDKENPPAPPKEINSSPLTPQTTLPGASATIDFDTLASQIDEAAGGKIHSQSLLIVGPVVEMLASGASLELDILPAVKATASRSNKSFPLSYHLPAMRQAYERRINAGRDLPKPKELEMSDDAWARRLRFARSRKEWSTVEWGPMPGARGCQAPPHLVEQSDGDGWSEPKETRRAA